MTTAAQVGQPVLAVLAAMALTSGFAPVADAGTPSSAPARLDPPPSATPVPTPPATVAQVRSVVERVRAIAGGDPFSDHLGTMDVNVSAARVTVRWKGDRPAALTALAGTHDGVTVEILRAKVSELQVKHAIDRLTEQALRTRAAGGRRLRVCAAWGAADGMGVTVRVCYADSRQNADPVPDGAPMELQRLVPGVPIISDLGDARAWAPGARQGWKPGYSGPRWTVAAGH